MLESIFLPCKEWLPDQPEIGNPGLIVAKNCRPSAIGYASMDMLSPYADALSARPTGGFSSRAPNGDVVGFCGTAGNLYRQRLASWDDATQSGGYVSTSPWAFAQFGKRAIAVSAGVDPQAYDTTLIAPLPFADLGGSPPQARTIAVVRDHVVLGNLKVGTNEFPNDVQWSGFNNAETWTPSLATQADRQEVFGGGYVARVIGGEYGLVLCESAIFRMTYADPSIIFQFDQVELGRGCSAPESVVKIGSRVYYLSQDGFYMFDGQQSAAIDSNKVRRWFFNEVAAGALADVRGAIDWMNRSISWAFKTSSSLTFADRILVYSWETDKWSFAEVDVGLIYDGASVGATLDDLDSVFADLEAGGDFSVDSDAYVGGSLRLTAFDALNRASTFSGDAMKAEFEFADIHGEGKDLTTTRQRPLVNGGDQTATSVSVVSRNSSAAAPILTPRPPPDFRKINRYGDVNNRSAGRYLSVKMAIEGGFRSAEGCRLFLRRTGRRSL